MAIEVKWDDELVGRIDDGQLVSGTLSFQGIWDDFKKNGVQMMVSTKGFDQELFMSDGFESSSYLGTFLAELEKTGFAVEDEEG